MKNGYSYDIDISNPEIVSLIHDDTDCFKTCHLCGNNKPYMMFSFITSKLDRVERDFWDYAVFLWMGAISALSLLARWHSKVLTKIPWDRFYQFIPLHLWICKECLDKKTNKKGTITLKESDFKKHPLYSKSKELWYKKILFQESYTFEDLQWKSFQKDLNKIREMVNEMEWWKNNTQLNNSLPNNIANMQNKSYDEYWFDEDWYNREWYDAYWYDREWFNKQWWNRKWYDRNGYDEDWFNVKWYDEDWFDREWYNIEWLDRQWFNKKWWNKKWINKKTGKEYDKSWFNLKWIHKGTWTRYDRLWYDRYWYDEKWYDKDWYDIYWFNKKWYNKERYDKYWYDNNWRDKDWNYINWSAKRKYLLKMRAIGMFCTAIIIFMILASIFKR